jgi:hypothetical protein
LIEQEADRIDLPVHAGQRTRRHGLGTVYNNSRNIRELHWLFLVIPAIQVSLPDGDAFRKPRLRFWRMPVSDAF